MAKEKKVVDATKGTKLAVRRSVESSQGLMYSVIENGRVEPIRLGVKTLRTSISNDSSESKDFNFDKSNIQKVQFAKLNNDSRKLMVRFDIKFTDFLKIESIDETEQKFVDTYNEILDQDVEKTEQAQDAIAHAYAYRIVAGDTLWRNKESNFGLTTKIEVETKTGRDINVEEMNFTDCDLMSSMVFNYDNGNLEYNLPTQENVELFLRLKNIIKDAMFNQVHRLALRVEYICDLGIRGGEVYPSQLMDDPIKDGSLKDVGKFLLDSEGVAAISSQKIQNALRTFDHFYVENKTGIRKELAIDAYGVDLSREVAIRKDNQSDFYAYKEKISSKKISELTLEETIYVTAMFVRGGIFNKSKSK